MVQSFDFFSLIWINGWVNNRDTGDLRRHRAHHDVTVMESMNLCLCLIRRWMSSVCHVSGSRNDEKYKFVFMFPDKYQHMKDFNIHTTQTWKSKNSSWSNHGIWRNELGQHWHRYWPVARRHNAITWTNVDLSSVSSSDIRQRKIS